MSNDSLESEESALLDALRRGDEDAFAQLVRKHHASLRRVARLFVANPAIADEVVQDTWLGVIRGIWAFEGRSSLRTWILRILVNRARTRAVRERRASGLIDVLSSEGDVEAEPTSGSPHLFPADGSFPPGRGVQPQAPDPTPEHSVLTKELRQRLSTVVDALPPNLRIVLWLRDVEGWSASEVCNALTIQETNQRVLLHRARLRARAALGTYLEEMRGGARGR